VFLVGGGATPPASHIFGCWRSSVQPEPPRRREQQGPRTFRPAPGANRWRESHQAWLSTQIVSWTGSSCG